MTEAFQIVQDVWLSEVMERGVYVVKNPEGSDAKAISRIRTQPENGGSFFYTKVPVHAVDTMHRFTENGFSVIDTNITFESENAAAVHSTFDGEVLDGPGEFADDTIDLAGKAFEYSRFHLDPKIGNQVADRVKREWVRNYCSGNRGDRLFVAITSNGVAGFLAALLTADCRPVAVIDLIAVDPCARGQGVAKALIRAFACAYGAKTSRLRVGTQIANLPSMRLYASCGFEVAGASYVLHAHL